MARQGGGSRHLTSAQGKKAPRGNEAPWRRRSRGRKEAPWDIIGGMTDDRIAYQLAQRPSGPCVSLWKKPASRRRNEGGPRCGRAPDASAVDMPPVGLLP